jgi:uncharacterized UBP type Zn finger protein
MNGACEHADLIQAVKPSAKGCEDCLKMGGHWVHLRMCLVCGHAGCCDDSPNRHARGHFHATDHPVLTSLEPGEHWKYCFIDDTVWM